MNLVAWGLCLNIKLLAGTVVPRIHLLWCFNPFFTITTSKRYHTLIKHTKEINLCLVIFFRSGFTVFFVTFIWTEQSHLWTPTKISATIGTFHTVHLLVYTLRVTPLWRTPVIWGFTQINENTLRNTKKPVTEAIREPKVLINSILWLCRSNHLSNRPLLPIYLCWRHLLYKS